MLELGWTVVGPATTLEDALQTAKSGGFDAALLDVNLKGELVYPVAEILKARGTPIVFLTGYGTDALPPEFREYQCLEKPFTRAQLARALDEHCHPTTTEQGSRPARRASPPGRHADNSDAQSSPSEERPLAARAGARGTIADAPRR